MKHRAAITILLDAAAAMDAAAKRAWDCGFIGNRTVYRNAAESYRASILVLELDCAPIPHLMISEVGILDLSETHPEPLRTAAYPNANT